MAQTSNRCLTETDYQATRQEMSALDFTGKEYLVNKVKLLCWSADLLIANFPHVPNHPITTNTNNFVLDELEELITITMSSRPKYTAQVVVADKFSLKSGDFGVALYTCECNTLFVSWSKFLRSKSTEIMNKYCAQEGISKLHSEQDINTDNPYGMESCLIMSYVMQLYSTMNELTTVEG